jgi:prepilin-type N-terminal cleavage/methylation domain-containing protein
MNYLRTKIACSKGFTLIEVIATIIAAGILGAIFIQLMGTALNSGWNAVEIVRDEANAEKVMEQIIANYVANINSDPATTLNNIFINYNGQTIDGVSITTQYIDFDPSGNEIAAGLSDNLKVYLKASGVAAPAITGRFPLTMILTNSRKAANDSPVLY